MKIRRIFFLINCLWELVRFSLLLAALRLKLSSSFVWLVLIGCPHLLLPAGLLFLSFSPQRFAPLLNLMRLGKFLGILASTLLLILESGTPDLQALPLRILDLQVSPLSLLIGVTLLDLLFLSILLAYRIPERGGEPEAGPSGSTADREPLPELKETVLEAGLGAEDERHDPAH